MRARTRWKEKDCARMREKESVFVCKNERDREYVRVCKREREREREQTFMERVNEKGIRFHRLAFLPPINFKKLSQCSGSLILT